MLYIFYFKEAQNNKLPVLIVIAIRGTWVTLSVSEASDSWSRAQVMILQLVRWSAIYADSAEPASHSWALAHGREYLFSPKINKKNFKK